MPLKRQGGPSRELEENCGHEQEVDRSQEPHERRGDRGARDRPNRPTGRYEPEESLSLGRVIGVGHEGPKDRHDEQVEDAHPDEEDPSHPDALCRVRDCEKQIERDQHQDENPVDPGDEDPAGVPRHQPCEDGVQNKHPEEGAGEEPGEVLHPASYPHLVPNGTENEVGREDEEEVHEGPAHCRDLVLPYVDRPPE